MYSFSAGTDVAEGLVARSPQTAVGALALLALTALALLPQAALAFRGSNGEIAYSSSGSIYSVKADGSDRSRLSSSGSDADPAFSPLGLRVGFERTTSSNRDIWVMHSDGSGQRRLTGATALDEDPAWSPNGEKLAWMRDVSGNWDIHTANADGTGVKRVTAKSNADYEPAWSHGAKIAFVRNLSGNHDIHTMDADGSRLKRVTSGSAKDTSPSWSPDSGKIAFVRSGDIYTVNPDGSGLQRLTTSGGLDPAWSPDGQKIAFSRGPAGDREIYVMNRDGSGTQQVTLESADARHPDWQSTGHDPVIAGAGDIACDPASTYFNGGSGTSSSCRQKYTADLLLNMDLNKVINLGDNQYTEGTRSQFDGSYDRSWGRSALKTITAPSVGNHEYRDPHAEGYFDYFNGVGNFTGPAGDRDKGYYSYDIGDTWHVIVLNSNCGYALVSANVPGGCGVGSPQETWLRADLAANTRPCTLAYFHHPLFRGEGRDERGAAFWDALYEAGADLVLNGHLHNYERSALQDPSGNLDPSRGIRQIVAGNGGKSLAASTPAPNTQVANSDTYGVLKVTLRSGSYAWKMVPEVGKTFTDSGTTTCHAKPADPAADDTTSLAAPRTLTATNGDAKVELDWSDNSETDLDGYNVYRSSSQSASYTKVNGSPVTSSWYTDSDVTNGNRYYYVVKAVDKAGGESPASNEVSATPSDTPGYRDKVFATSGLISYWRLGESSGTTAADEKGAYAGTYRGGVSLGEPGVVASDSDTAARFDGSDDETAAGGSALALSTGGTIEGWFKWESGVALLRDTTSGGGWILAYDNAGNLAYRVGGNTYTTSRTTASVKDDWHHLALTVSGGNTALYIDGALVHTGSGAGTAAAEMPWRVMRNGNANQFTRGAADEVAIYGEALSATTVAEHYQAGTK